MPDDIPLASLLQANQKPVPTMIPPPDVSGGTIPLRDAMLGFLGGVAEPVTNAGWYLGGIMQGTEKPNGPDIVRHAGDLLINAIGPKGLEGGAMAATKAIVPAIVGKRLNVAKSLPLDEMFSRAVQNTKGARLEEGSLVLPVERRQKPEQELADSVRGGVFYLPQGSKDTKYYSGTGHNFSYGGSDKISGETAFNNPLFVKGATGGNAPKAAFDHLNGKGAYESMRDDALRSSGGYYLSHDDKVDLAGQFLEKYAPEMYDLADHIVRNSKKGNQLPYALQEAAVASAARNAGHDGIVGYSVGRKTKDPFISEVFDVRENVYPSASGDYGMWPQYKTAPNE